MAVKFATSTKSAATPQKKSLSFLKRGKEAQEEFAREEHRIEESAKNSVWRFSIKDGESAIITFLDGDLKDGVLNVPFYYDHTMYINNRFHYYVCTQDDEPCPICESGETASYVGLMTIINHTPYTTKKSGKTIVNQRQLFVAKRDTIKMLQKIAVKRGGLTGVTFDVSRSGDKSPRVGNMFEFEHKKSISEIAAEQGQENAMPLDYDAILTEMYLPAKKLRELGFGSMSSPIGSKDVEESVDYSDVL